MQNVTTVGSNLVHSLRSARRSAALVAGLMIALAIPASADIVGITGGTLIVAAEAGDGNQVFAPTIVNSDLVFPDLDADIVTPGCTGVGSVICPLTGFQDLVILGGDGDDVITLAGISGLTFPITALGGVGNDILIGTPGNVKLFGGPGDDVLVIKPGNCFSRGTGLDVVIGGGCDAGPEPTFTLPQRQFATTPEPAGFLLIGTVLLAVAATGRIASRCGKIAEELFSVVKAARQSHSQ
jgi:Ca2+-binding RTX toxin-like protein